MTTAEFNNLPRKEKAVLVAKDIIEQIKIGRYIPNRGFYINDLRSTEMFSEDSVIRDAFNDIQECRVCAIGATILSATHLGNRLKVTDLNINYLVTVHKLRNPKVIKLLDSIFDDRTLLLIESCFEGFIAEDDRYATKIKRYSYSYITSEVINKCNAFKEQYENTDDRLIAICQNIITNGGEFKI